MNSLNITSFVLTLITVGLLVVAGALLTESATAKCVGQIHNTDRWQLSYGLEPVELMFGNERMDFERAQRLCKTHNARLPYEGIINIVRLCLLHKGSDDYYWLQTCSKQHGGRVFSVGNTTNMFEEKYHNFVCVITTDIKTDLTIQVEDQSNTTYSNKETKNIFQAWSGQTLNLFCESGLLNMSSRLCVKSGNNNVTCTNSSIMTWTPENCEDDITVTCESRHCSSDVHPAVKTNVSIKVQCPLEIVSFASHSRVDTEGIHIYKTGEDATYTCVTKGSSDVTIVKTQGGEMRGTVVSRSHTYSITSLSCDDTGTYYCIAKQGDSQVNKSINIRVHGSCRLLLITPPPVTPSGTATVTTTVAPLKDTPEAASHSLGVIIGIVSILIVLLIIMLGVLYWKMKGECGKHGSYTCYSPPSTKSNHNGHSNGGSKNADDVELYSTVTVANSPNPIQVRGDSQESTESRYMPWSAVERESNVNLNQNLTETKCSSTEERYANLRTLKNMPGPSGLTVSQQANNGALKAHRQNGYHPMKPVSSNPTTSSYTSPEGLHYVTVAHSQSSGSKQSSLKREGDSKERDSVQYASLDFEKTGKYDTKRDQRKLKMLKHKTHC